MCDCLKKYNSAEHWQKGNKTITSVELEVCLVQLENKVVTALPAIRMTYTVSFKKKPMVTSIPAVFCPFCGEKYGAEPDEKPNEKV